MCKKSLPLTSYNKKKFPHAGRIGLCSECRVCASKRAKKWVGENRKRFNAYQREYSRRAFYFKKFEAQQKKSNN